MEFFKWEDTVIVFPMLVEEGKGEQGLEKMEKCELMEETTLE